MLNLQNSLTLIKLPFIAQTLNLFRYEKIYEKSTNYWNYGARWRIFS